MSRGSSPRLWGTHNKQCQCFFIHRFIPTPVGNTPGRKPGQARRAVHPHACGEHFKIYTLPSFQAGSSPRLWGTRPKQRRSPGLHRFIPTPVGNTPFYWI
ncbi:hypothetical protein D1AOALGA4SA_11474 [Olavius algarvensis Delta 1 endosymbiont]|nr:hypothetical protein D1AOALGA4SA_11474 [Olavius algarvensis Delta 1 endosymbiont]